MGMDTWRDYAEYHHERSLDHLDRRTLFDEKTCVARLMRSDHSGENRFYMAPTEDGVWYAWGTWHGRVDSEDGSSGSTVISEIADDATYTFVDGGAYFQTRDEAMAAIYRWIQRDLALEIQEPTVTAANQSQARA
jgi:hypothetical protein